MHLDAIHRPSPEPTCIDPRPAAGRAMTALSARLRSWARRLDARALREFAEGLGRAREPSEIRAGLVRAAVALAGADRAELLSEGGGPIIRWPGSSPDDSGAGADAFRWLHTPIRFGGRSTGALRLRLPAGRRASAGVLRGLQSLATMAAAAELALHAGAADVPRSTRVGVPEALRDATFLEGFLPYAVAQARRRGEPLTLLAIATDRLGAIAGLHGLQVADEAVGRVAAAVLGTLRSSDLVARLDDGRIFAVLSAVAADDAWPVAEAIRAAIAEAGRASTAMPALTATIGLAGYPDHAHDAITLRAAAAGALAAEAGRGRDRVVGPVRRDPAGLAG